MKPRSITREAPQTRMSHCAGNGKPKYSAPAAACTAELLLVLARSDSPLSIAQLSERTGYTKSLIYRVLEELEHRHYISKAPERLLHARPRCRRVGRRLRSLGPTNVVGETRSPAAGRRHGGDGQLGHAEGRPGSLPDARARSVFAVSHVGNSLPANAVALGKALLSLKTEPEIRDAFASRLYAYGELAALTPKTITSLDALLEDLERARQRGHAEEHGEAVVGRCCVAAPVEFNQQGIDDVAVSISMNEAGFHTERERILRALF